MSLFTLRRAVLATCRRPMVIGTALVFALTLRPDQALSQRLAPAAVMRTTTSLKDAKALPILVESQSHRRLVISAAIGAVVGGAAGAYQAHGTVCLVSGNTQCVSNNYLRYISVGAVVGALIGVLVGGSTQ